MKTAYITLAFVVAFAFGCASPSKVESRADHIGDLSQEEKPSRLETINYDWEKYGIRIAFYRLDDNPLWRMKVEDSWSIYDQFDKVERTWDTSQSKCSADDCVRTIDRSLGLFHAEKPGAKLDTLDLEMQVVRELWADTLAGLSRTLSAVDTTKPASRADVPDEVDRELQHLASTSTVIEKVKTLLERHGMRVQRVYRGNMPTFKDSLTGHKWSEIGKLPDAGILVPGTFEFDLGGSSIKESKVAVLQSVTR